MSVTTSELRARLLGDIEGLCRFERPSASEGEREAAYWVASRFRDAGLEPEVEEFLFYPDYWTVWAAHMGLGLAAAAIGRRGRRMGRLGAVLGAATALSFWGDASGRFHWLRSLFPARPSYNVVARLRNPEAQRIIVVSAHHDAAHSGLPFHPAIQRWLAAQYARRGEPFPAVALPFLGLLGATAGSAVRALLPEADPPSAEGAGPRLASAIGAPGRLICALTALVMGHIGRSPVSPGANDDASGVAVVLALARELVDRPPDGAEVWFLSTGSEEGILGGMKAFLERHRQELEGRRPFFINLETLGAGQILYLTAEGLVTRFSYHPEATTLAQRVTAEPEFGGIQPVSAPYASDALVATHHGFPAITVASLGPEGYLPHYHWPTDVPENIDLGSVERAYAFARRLFEVAADQRPPLGGANRGC